MLRIVSLCTITSLALAGCQNLYVASDTQAGITASLNSTKTSGKVSFAWERDFVVIVPRSATPKNGNRDGDASRQRTGSTGSTGGEPSDEASTSADAQFTYSGKDAQQRSGVDKNGSNHKEAMAVISCSDFEADGIYITRFKQRLATGTAAVNLANAMGGEGNQPAFDMKCVNTTTPK